LKRRDAGEETLKRADIGMTTKELIKEHKQRREKIVAMGGLEAIEKCHERGQWTAT